MKGFLPKCKRRFENLKLLLAYMWYLLQGDLPQGQNQMYTWQIKAKWLFEIHSNFTPKHTQYLTQTVIITFLFFY